MSVQEWADKAIKYILEKTVNFDAPENFQGWCEQYKKESGYDKSGPNLRAAITRKLEKIEEMKGYTMLQKVQLLFVLSQPVSTPFFESVKKAKCTIELDHAKRISLFCSADDKLIRSGDHGMKNKLFNGKRMERKRSWEAMTAEPPTSSNQPSTSSAASSSQLAQSATPSVVISKQPSTSSAAKPVQQPSKPAVVVKRSQPTSPEEASSEDDDDIKIIHFPANHRPTQITKVEPLFESNPPKPLAIQISGQVSTHQTVKSPSTSTPESKNFSLTLPNMREPPKGPPNSYDYLIHLLRTVEVLDNPVLATIKNRIQLELANCRRTPLDMNRVDAIVQGVVICATIYRNPEKQESILVGRYLLALQHTIVFLNSESLEPSKTTLKNELRREDLGDVKITMDRVAQGIDQLLLAATN